MSTYPIYLRPELAPIIAETPEQTTWDLPAMRAGGDALLANPHEADNRVEVSARGRTFIPADLAEDAPLITDAIRLYRAAIASSCAICRPSPHRRLTME